MAIGLALQDDDQGIQIQTMFDECFIVFGLTVFLIGKICFFHTKEKVAPDCYKRSFAPVFHHFSPVFGHFASIIAIFEPLSQFSLASFAVLL